MNMVLNNSYCEAEAARCDAEATITITSTITITITITITRGRRDPLAAEARGAEGNYMNAVIH